MPTSSREDFVNGLLRRNRIEYFAAEGNFRVWRGLPGRLFRPAISAGNGAAPPATDPEASGADWSRLNRLGETDGRRPPPASGLPVIERAGAAGKVGGADLSEGSGRVGVATVRIDGARDAIAFAGADVPAGVPLR